MSENFDTYADGDILSIVGSSNGWGEWNGGSGTTESNTASSMFAFSGLNSGKAVGGNNGLWTWTDLTEGTLKFSMQLYVPDESNGAFIGLGDAAMTSQPNSINVLGDSLLFALDWGAQALIGSPVAIVSDSWIAIDFILDIDNVVYHQNQPVKSGVLIDFKRYIIRSIITLYLILGKES